MKKQMASEALHSSMLGPTAPSARPTWASRRSPGLRGSLCAGTAGGSGAAGEPDRALAPARGRRPPSPGGADPADTAVPSPLPRVWPRRALGEFWGVRRMLTPVIAGTRKIAKSRA